MADDKQLARLRSGVEEWNLWRKGEGQGVSIDLREAELIEVDLGHAYLRGANLEGAKLKSANLRAAKVMEADLREANLNGADLSYANLAYANLSYADLGGADLFRTDLNGAKLSGAKLGGAKIGFSSLAGLDLSGVQGLAEVRYSYPSSIDTLTLERTAQGLASAPPERRGEVETFLRGAGVSESYVDVFSCQIGAPIEFYSAFISYSHLDKTFAHRLYADLQARGIRCWLDEKDGRIGDPIYEAVNQAIRSNDRKSSPYPT